MDVKVEYQPPALTTVEVARAPGETREIAETRRPVEAAVESAELKRQPRRAEAEEGSRGAERERPAEAVAEKERALLEELSSSSKIQNARLQIDTDEATGSYVYKSIDPESGDVIEQYPREEVLRALARLDEAAGVVLDTSA